MFCMWWGSCIAISYGGGKSGTWGRTEVGARMIVLDWSTIWPKRVSSLGTVSISWTWLCSWCEFMEWGGCDEVMAAAMRSRLSLEWHLETMQQNKTTTTITVENTSTSNPCLCKRTSSQYPVYIRTELLKTLGLTAWYNREMQNWPEMSWPRCVQKIWVASWQCYIVKPLCLMKCHGTEGWCSNIYS
jgi:hypothetical protein